MGKMVNYLRIGALVKVVYGDGEKIPQEPLPSTDAEYIGRIGRMVDDGGLADHGCMRYQFIEFNDGEIKRFRGWQLEYVEGENA